MGHMGFRGGDSDLRVWDCAWVLSSAGLAHSNVMLRGQGGLKSDHGTGPQGFMSLVLFLSTTVLRYDPHSCSRPAGSAGFSGWLGPWSVQPLILGL